MCSSCQNLIYFAPSSIPDIKLVGVSKQAKDAYPFVSSPRSLLSTGCLFIFCLCVCVIVLCCVCLFFLSSQYPQNILMPAIRLKQFYCIFCCPIVFSLLNYFIICYLIYCLQRTFGFKTRIMLFNIVFVWQMFLA